MKKKLVASLAAAMVLGIAGTSFAAANPFVDVPAKHWAYDSVMKLGQAGMIDGYANGQFQGDKTITRYEMAQIVAKVMVKEDKASAMQKAEIEKLKVEFADELNKIGVRVDALEKNQPNLKFAGNFTIRDTDKNYVNNGVNNNDNTRYRLRLDGTAKVDDDTTFGFRIVTANPTQNKLSAYGITTNTTWVDFGKTTATSGAASDSSVSTSIDRVFVNTKIADVNTTLGRQALVVGTTSGIVDAGAISFDGAKFSKKFGDVQAVANWGRLISKIDVRSLELSTTTGKLTYGAGAFKMENDANNVAVYNGATSLGRDMLDLQYANATYNFDPTLSATAEGGQNKASYATTENKYYNLLVKYGDQVLDAKGKQNFIAQYYTVGKNALALDPGVSGGATPAGLTTLDTATTNSRYTGLDLSFNHSYSKNLFSELHYVKLTDKSASASVNNYNYYRLNITAKF